MFTRTNNNDNKIFLPTGALSFSKLPSNRALHRLVPFTEIVVPIINITYQLRNLYDNEQINTKLIPNPLYINLVYFQIFNIENLCFVPWLTIIE